MFRNHVTEHLSSYCHGELSDSESRRVAEHLIGCGRCRVEFEEVKFGVKLAEQLPVMPAPDTIWSGIESSLPQQRAANVVDLPRRSFVKPAVAMAAGLAVLVLGGFLFMRTFRRDTPPLASWEVARIDGAPRIGAASIGDKGRLAIGQWLETDGSSRARSK
jgi:anti-sigma factor RsiW